MCMCRLLWSRGAVRWCWKYSVCLGVQSVLTFLPGLWRVAGRLFRLPEARPVPGAVFFAVLGPWWLILGGYAARVSSRRARWLVRVRSRGWSFHQASSRIRLRATAE